MQKKIELDPFCFSLALERFKQFKQADVYMQLEESDLKDLIEAYLIEWNAQNAIAQKYLNKTKGGSAK